MKQTRWFSLVLVVLLLAIVSGCGKTSPTSSTDTTPVSPDSTNTITNTTTNTSTESTGKVLRIMMREWPATLDPQVASYTNEMAVVALNYEGLTRLDKNLETVPGTAESWVYNQDSTEITFTLRSNATYSDGSPLTANDYLYAIKRALSPDVAGYYQTSLDMIAGANAVIDAGEGDDVAALLDALGVAAPDEHTLVITFERPTPYFHTVASLVTMYPSKQARVEQGGELWFENPDNLLGNGPFQITNIDPVAQTIALRANEHYWQGKPQLDGIVLTAIEDPAVALQAYQNNEIDVVIPSANDLPGILSDEQLSKEYVGFTGGCTEYYTFNISKPPLDNVKVRQALNYAFDRETFVRDIMQGKSVVSQTWIPPTYPGHDAEQEDRYTFDPAKARELLAEAGYPNGEGMPDIVFAFDSADPSLRTTATYLVQMYQQQLGITIKAEALDGETLRDLMESVETHPQMVIFPWCADYPDPQNWVDVIWYSQSAIAQNQGYRNPAVDALIDKANTTLDEQQRIALYIQAQRLILDDAPMIIRSVNKNHYLIKPYVTGFVFTPQDIEIPGTTTDLLNVTIEK